MSTTFTKLAWVVSLFFVGCTKPEAPAPAPPAPTLGAASGGPRAEAPSASPADSRPSAGVEWIDAPAEGDFASAVRLARAKAARSGRTLVVYVGADWCPPCKAFHKAVLAHALDAQLGKTTFLAFDFDRDAAKMGSFGYQTTHIPYFVKPGPDGAPDGSFNVKTLDGTKAVKEAVGQLVVWQGSVE